MNGDWTEGPWHVGMRNGSNACMVFAYHGEDSHGDSAIAMVYGIPDNWSVDQCGNAGIENMANAYLISAAPDLYDALWGLYASVYVDDDGEDMILLDPGMYDEIARVLAKAKGEVK